MNRRINIVSQYPAVVEEKEKHEQTVDGQEGDQQLSARFITLSVANQVKGQKKQLDECDQTQYIEEFKPHS
jgi:hypothetical protein